MLLPLLEEEESFQESALLLFSMLLYGHESEMGLGYAICLQLRQPGDMVDEELLGFDARGVSIPHGKSYYLLSSCGYFQIQTTFSSLSSSVKSLLQVNLILLSLQVRGLSTVSRVGR